MPGVYCYHKQCSSFYLSLLSFIIGIIMTTVSSLLLLLPIFGYVHYYNYIITNGLPRNALAVCYVPSTYKDYLKCEVSKLRHGFSTGLALLNSRLPRSGIDLCSSDCFSNKFPKALRQSRG